MSPVNGKKSMNLEMLSASFTGFLKVTPFLRDSSYQRNGLSSGFAACRTDNRYGCVGPQQIPVQTIPFVRDFVVKFSANIGDDWVASATYIYYLLF